MIRRADRHCLRIAWAEPKSRVAGGLRKTQSVIPFSCTGKTHEREFRSLLLTVATDSYWFSLVCGVVTYVRNACFEDHFAQMMRHLLCADLARSKAFFEAWNKRSLLSFSWRWTVGCRVPPSPNPVARWVTSGLTKSRVPVPGVGVDRAGVRQPYWPVACLSGGPFFDPL